MTDILLDSIYAIVALGAWFVLRGRGEDSVPLVRGALTVLRAYALLSAFVLAGAAVSATHMSAGDAFGVGAALLVVYGLARAVFDKVFGKAIQAVGAGLGLGGGAAGTHLRGSQLVSSRQLQSLLKKESGSLTVGSQKIPGRLEPLSFLVAGAPGVGKSVAISEMLDGIAARGDRAFISDAGGNYLKSYFNPSRGDLVLNPLDRRAVLWSPLAEIENSWDADQISKSIIPAGTGSAAEWNNYAQTAVAAILKHCWARRLTNAAIFRLAIISSIDELQTIFAGTPAAPLVAEGAERMWASIRGIIGTYLTPLQYLDPDTGVGGFSLKKRIQEETPGWLFFNFRDDQLTAISPVIAAMADIISKAILSLDANDSRKFWLILDEFASLGRITSILDFLTKARKNGGRAVVGVQAVSQIRSAYGPNDSSTLLATCGSQVIFRVPDAETADVMSRVLGDHQIVRTIESQGESSGGMQMIGQSSKNESTQYTTERVVLPSQIQSLETLHAILNFAGAYPAAPIILEPRDRETVVKTFEPVTRRAIVATAGEAAAESETAEIIPDDDLPTAA